MSNRVIISCIGGFISVYCAVVALLTFFKFNFATYHLPGVLNSGFASLYGILSPTGLTGVLGGINRKRNLIKGFLFQYWISSILMIGLSVANILLFNQYHKSALNKCSNSLTGKGRKNPQTICNERLQNTEKFTFIAAYVQGGVLVLMGIILLYCGYKELKDILLDVETKNLIENSLKENALMTPDNGSINDNNEDIDNKKINNERFTSPRPEPGNYPVGRDNNNVTFNRIAPPNHNNNNNQMYLQQSNSQTNLPRYADRSHPTSPPPQYIPQLSAPLPIQQKPIQQQPIRKQQSLNNNNNNNNNHYYQQQLKNRPSQKSLNNNQNNIPLQPLPNNQQQYQQYQQLNNVKPSRNKSNGSNGSRSDNYIRINNNNNNNHHHHDNHYYYNNNKNNYNNNNNYINDNNNHNNNNNNNNDNHYNGYDDIYNDYT